MMKEIMDEQWESKWLPKISTVIEILNDEPKRDGLFGVGQFIRQTVNAATDNFIIRVPFIQMIRQMVKGNQQLTYIMGGRSRLPWAVRTVIQEVVEQIGEEARIAYSESTWLQQLTFNRRFFRMYNSDTGQYEKVLHDNLHMDGEDYQLKIERHWGRKLTQWYKQGIWNGTHDGLEFRLIERAMLKFENQKVEYMEE